MPDRDKFLAILTEEEWQEWMNSRVFETNRSFRQPFLYCPMCKPHVGPGIRFVPWVDACRSCMGPSSTSCQCILSHPHNSDRYVSGWNRLASMGLVPEVPNDV